MAKSTRYSNHCWNENNHYKNRCKTIKKIMKDSVFENAAICDEITHTQEKLLIVREECKFLTKKLKQFEPPPGTPGPVKVETPVVKKTSPRKKPIKTVAVTNGACASKPKRPPAPKRKKNIGLIQEPVTSGDVTIFNFGQIVYDTPFYYSDCAIYPPGYYATRTYAHFRNIFSRCTYHCKVIRAGTSPRFEIMDHDKHFKVTGLSTDECHSHLVSLINKMLGADDLIPSNTNGDRFFGLTLPLVRLKLQSKPESKFCTGYIPLKSQFDSYESEIKAENDPSISFEGLHACLNKFRSRR